MYYLMLRGMGGGEGAVDCVDGKQGIGKRTSSLDFYHWIFIISVVFCLHPILYVHACLDLSV